MEIPTPIDIWRKKEEKGYAEVKLIIFKANRLGWIQNINGQPMMHLADVEKAIVALYDPDYMKQLDRWLHE